MLGELLNPESLVGLGLESWTEPRDMASFIFWLRTWDSNDLHIMIDQAQALSRNWQDRQKADAFVTAVDAFYQRLRNDLGESSEPEADSEDDSD